MPLYEYVCKECGLRFDVLRSMSQADAPIACQGCRSKETERALSVFFASSGGKVVAGGGSGCGSCSGGSCSTCGVN
jgi:putative FmdB family regulatory protein